MACKNDITLAWSWLVLGDVDAEPVFESGQDAQHRESADPPYELADAVEDYFALLTRGRSSIIQ